MGKPTENMEFMGQGRMFQMLHAFLHVYAAKPYKCHHFLWQMISYTKYSMPPQHLPCIWKSS